MVNTSESSALESEKPSRTCLSMAKEDVVASPQSINVQSGYVQLILSKFNSDKNQKKY